MIMTIIMLMIVWALYLLLGPSARVVWRYRRELLGAARRRVSSPR